MSKSAMQLAGMAFFLWAGASLTPAFAASPVEIRDLRLWASPDGTRVVLDLSSAADHQLFTLRDPDRVVIDIPSARLLDVKAPPGQGLVREIRKIGRAHV